MTTASSAVVPEPVSVTPELLAQHSITQDEYNRILSALGRVPSLTELGIYSVMWSEHCSYKSSRVHLKRLPTKSDRVVQGPGENAGIIDVGDGWACAFKIESHNHPSYIEPYQGAATGVGGILRDVLTGTIPLVFRPAIYLYATAALCGAVVYVLVLRWAPSEAVAAVSGIVTTLGLRLAAIRWKLGLPLFHVRAGE